MSKSRDAVTDPISNWLDAFVAGTSTPAPEPAADPELSALCATASQFHGLAQAGARYAAATSRLPVTWEDLMSTHVTSAHPMDVIPSVRGIFEKSRSPAKPAVSNQPREDPFDAGRSIRRGRTRSTSSGQAPGPPLRGGWHVALNVVLAAMLILALTAGIWRATGGFIPSFGDDPRPPTIPFGGFVAQVGTPTAAASANLAPISPEDCDVERRSVDEFRALLRDPGESEPRAYGPVAPADPRRAQEVSDANRVFQSCHSFGRTSGLWAMLSPRLISEGAGSPYVDAIARNSPTFEEYVATHRQLSETLLAGGTGEYEIVSGEEVPIDENGEVPLTGLWLPVVLPEDMVQFPDGRIGGPGTSLLPANHEEATQALDGGSQATPSPVEFELVSYFIYSQDPTQDGRWVLDELLTLCASGCDAYYPGIEVIYQANTMIPPATPVATPAADSRPGHSVG